MELGVGCLARALNSRNGLLMKSCVVFVQAVGVAVESLNSCSISIVCGDRHAVCVCVSVSVSGGGGRVCPGNRCLSIVSGWVSLNPQRDGVHGIRC